MQPKKTLIAMAVLLTLAAAASAETFKTPDGRTVNAEKNTETREYDSNGNCIHQKNDYNEIWNKYDSNNNKVLETWRSGYTLYYVYDSENRLIVQSDSDGSACSAFYDSNGHISRQVNNEGDVAHYSCDSKGTILHLWTDWFSYSYKYDSNNNCIEEINDDTGYFYINEYDKHNNKIHTKQKDKETWYVNTYNSKNQLIKIETYFIFL